MNAKDILKLAKVKTEAELYAKYPKHEDFIAKFGKQIKKLALGSAIENNAPINTNQPPIDPTAEGLPTRDLADRQPFSFYPQWQNTYGIPNMRENVNPASINSSKGNVQLLNTIGKYSGVVTAEEGTTIPIAEDGRYQQRYNDAISNNGIPTSNNQLMSPRWDNNQLATSVIDPYQISSAEKPMDLATSFPDKGSGLLKSLGGAEGIAGTAGKLIGGIQALSAEKQQRKQAQQTKDVSDLALQASRLRPEQINRRYVRPEDIQNTGAEFFPVYGAGTNVLGKNGLSIGGNPTEIQNTYNSPNDIYTNGGFEPLNDSSRVKQFYFGGKQTAAFGADLSSFAEAGGTDFASKLITGIGGKNAGGDIGGTLGNTVGSAIEGPVGGMVGQVGGQIIGGLLDRNPHKIKEYQKQTNRNLGNMFFNRGMQGAQQQYNSYMEDGGELPIYAEGGTHLTPRYLDLPDTPMMGLNLIGQNYSPNPEQSSQDSITYRNNFNKFIQNPSLFNEGESERALLDITNQRNDIDEYTKRKNYAEAHQYLTAGRDALEQLKHLPVQKRYDPSDQVKHAYTQTYENGGWMNPEYNPQVITKFGDTSAEDLFKFSHENDTLRAGGNLKSYMVPSENSLQTYDMGGELQIHGKGYAEPISNNPYLPDGGETVMFRGPSHENGGMPISYGRNPVEVEGGEPAVKLQDGGGEDNLVVFGNLPIHKDYVSILGDEKAKGKKFKNYVADLSKQEERHNKTIESSLQELNDFNPITSFDQLKFNSLKANVQGAQTSLKSLAEKKQNAAALQQAINDTAEEHGLIAEHLAKGEIKKAKKGLSIPKTVGGKVLPEEYPKLLTPQDLQTRQTMNTLPIDYAIGTNRDIPTTTDNTTKSWGDNAMMYANQLIPYLKPQFKIAQPDLTPEMMAAGMNQLEPVYAQKYSPQLQTPYNISLQDQLSSIDGQSRAAIRAAGSNPAAQAQIAANTEEAKNKVLGEQFRINQGQQTQTFNQNINTMNQAQQTNLGILGQQYDRQSLAKSKTKEQQLNIAKSISDKMARAKQEQTIANLENARTSYMFDERGNPIYVGPTAQFNIPNVGGNQLNQPKTVVGPKGETLYLQYKNGVASYEPVNRATFDEPINPSTKKAKRNGDIVKAIKNL